VNIGSTLSVGAIRTGQGLGQSCWCFARKVQIARDSSHPSGEFPENPPVMQKSLQENDLEIHGISVSFKYMTLHQYEFSFSGDSLCWWCPKV
jgi:hypothetical protein